MSYMASNKELNFLNPGSQRFFRDLVENIKIGAFMADVHHNLFYVNHAFCDTFNLINSTHILGKKWSEVLILDEQKRKDCLTRLQSRGVVGDFEVSHTVLGTKITLLLNVNYIFNDRGQVIGTRGAVVNITEKLKLEAQIHIEHQKLEQVLNFYQVLSGLCELDGLTKHIVQETAHILGAKRCSLMFLETTKGEVYIKDSHGVPEEFIQEARVKIGQPVAGLLALHGHSVIVENIEQDKIFRRSKRKSYSSGSFISAPLIHENQLIGLLNVADGLEVFKPLDLKVLETIAKQSAVSIDKLLTLNKYQHLAETDPMTGLLNFRSFNLKLHEEVDRANRYATSLSLMMIDVDNFKTYNDTHGHPNGDALLKSLAGIFRSHVRSTESICRYGGDEFSIILPNTACADAAIVAEKLREYVAKTFISDRISLSVGVAQFEKGASKEELIKKADSALYQAKKSGRNRVFLSRNP